MPLRILCIHGAGDHPRQFEEQSRTLMDQVRLVMGASVVFDFHEGLIPVRSSNHSGHYPGPPGHRTHFNGQDPESIENAITALIMYVLNHGPYDGVLAFSFGAALAAMAIMEHRKVFRHDPGSRPLFGFAVFVCGMAPRLMLRLPLEALRGLVPDGATEADYDEVSRQAAATTLEQDIVHTRLPLMRRDPTKLKDGEKEYYIQELLGEIQLDTRGLEEIPTVHVLGGDFADPLKPASVALAYMCSGREPSFKAMHVHNEGHRMPQSIARARVIASDIQRAWQWTIPHPKKSVPSVKAQEGQIHGLGEGSEAAIGQEPANFERSARDEGPFSARRISRLATVDTQETISIPHIRTISGALKVSERVKLFELYKAPQPVQVSKSFALLAPTKEAMLRRIGEWA